MSNVVDEQTFQAWLDHPLVREAVDKAKPDGGAVAVLESLSCVLSRFEERFPGVPHRAVLEAQSNPDIDRYSIKAAMRRAGATEADISLALGATTRTGELSPTVFAQVRDWPSIAMWLANGYTVQSARRLMRLKWPLTELEKRAAELLADGMAVMAVTRALQITPETARTAKRKLAYQAWLASL
jgi:DNA-binding CsgD family transcriptional regulator